MYTKDIFLYLYYTTQEDQNFIFCVIIIQSNLSIADNIGT